MKRYQVRLIDRKGNRYRDNYDSQDQAEYMAMTFLVEQAHAYVAAEIRELAARQ